MKLYFFVYFSACLSCVIPKQKTSTPQLPSVQQTPVVQTPVVQHPVVQTPVVQTPVVQTPVVQTPVVQPVVEQNNQGSRTSILTYYFRVGQDIDGCAPVQSFDDGLSYGPCNINGNIGVKYTSESKYWVAINGAKEHCGKQIRVNYQGNSLDLTVMDECPGCGAGNTKIDVGLEALIELTKSKEVACSIGRTQPEVTWDFI